MIIKVVHLAFFSPVPALVHVRASSVALSPRLPATACSASRPLSRVASLWASLPNCSHSSVDRRCHLRVLASSSWSVSSVSSLAISQRVRVQVFPTLCQLSCWNTAWWLNLVLAMTLLPHSKRCQMGSINTKFYAFNGSRDRSIWLLSRRVLTVWERTRVFARWPRPVSRKEG